MLDWSISRREKFRKLHIALLRSANRRLHVVGILTPDIARRFVLANDELAKRALGKTTADTFR